MKTLEEVVEIKALHNQGFSQRRIARRLGISRQTVRKYLETPGAGCREGAVRTRSSMLDQYKANIEAWLEEDHDYQATRIHEKLCAMGFTGSYDIVKRQVRKLKSEKARVAYLRFETEPGRQAQVDFGEFQVENADGSVSRYYLFSMILGYSRKLYAEFIKRCDLPSFLDCHIRAFESLGGVPAEILYDRMKNVYLGQVAGKRRFNASLVGFGLHYGFKPLVAPAYAAWVKGKVERPYAFIREGFWRGYGFTSLERANRDLGDWLAIKDERIHGTTHEKVSSRFERERSHLGALPPYAFDTSFRIYRTVHKDCTVSFEGNAYVVPHTLVGRKVILRVKNSRMRIFADDRLVVVYDIPKDKGRLVQDRRFYEALRQDREMNARKYAQARKGKGCARQTISPRKPPYDMDVQARPIASYQAVAEAFR